MLPPFRSEPYTDFTKPENQAAFGAALERVKSEIGRTYPLVIGGQEIMLDDRFPSINPSRPNEVLGYFASGTVEHANQASEAASDAFESWKFVSAEERSRFLLRAAAALRRRKHEFSATMVLEVGKSWAEADADTAESIDFLEYYARQMLRLAVAYTFAGPSWSRGGSGPKPDS